MSNLTEFVVSGTNNGSKQVSKDKWNNLITEVAALSVATKAEMAAIRTPSEGDVTRFSDILAGGTFVFSEEDLTDRVAADPLQGIYIPPTGEDGSTGAWVRQEYILNPYMFGGVTNYKTGDRSTMVPPYGESQTEGEIDGILVDSREACQAVIDQVRLHENRVFVADFSDGLWGISANDDGLGLVIDQPIAMPRTFIGGEFRGIGAGTTLIHVENGSYSEFPGSWHIRSGADLGSGYGYAIRQWDNGLWLRNVGAARFGDGVVSGFKRWGVMTDPATSVVEAINNNIGCRMGRWWCSGCGSAANRETLELTIDFTASSRSGSGNSFSQRTNLTLGSGHEDLQERDIIQSPAGSWHIIMEKVGEVISVYPWIISEDATGTITSSHGGAMWVNSKDTAGFGADELTAVGCGVGLRSNGLFGSNFNEVIVEGCGLGLVYGYIGGSSLGHCITHVHSEANTLDLLGLSTSSHGLHIATASGWGNSDWDNPWSLTEIIAANDGSALNTTEGLGQVTLGLNGIVYSSKRNGSGSVGTQTKSRPFMPIISNDPSFNRLRKVQAPGVVTNVTLKYFEATDRLISDCFVATVEVVAPDGGAPTDDITITLDAADETAGITLDGSTDPYVIAGGSATGPVLLDLWLDTAGATKNWIVVQRSGTSGGGGSSALTGETLDLEVVADSRKLSVFESGGAWYLRAGIPGSVATNGVLNIQGQGVTQELSILDFKAQTTNFNGFGATWLSYSGGAADFSVPVNTPTAYGYRVNNTKVVGAQGAAVADATDAASAITQLNALLARCRAHGLIAT